jgi:hypothetical protein
MKTKIFTLILLSLISITNVFSQDRTTVTATNADISDNLDLRAVASIFGDSNNLEDFERRLNDPNAQISNLDLNNDNQVDYLRVIESVEGNTHLIIIQSVVGRDRFQDVASIEIEKDRNNRIQVQVVGDVFMYGNNYIYEPVYAFNPIIYNTFWVPNYRPYCSFWNWGFYPSFYNPWSPFPIFTYHNHIGIYINHNHFYNYVNFRRCHVAYNNYYNGRRGNAYERQFPNRSFSHRNSGFANRYELDTNRGTNTRSTRNNIASNNIRNNSGTVNSPRPSRTVKSSNEYTNTGNSYVSSSPRPSRTVKSSNEYTNTGNSYVSSSPRPSRTVKSSNEYTNTGNSYVSSSPRPSRTVKSSNEYLGSENNSSYSNASYSPRPSRTVKSSKEYTGNENNSSYSSSPRPSRTVKSSNENSQQRNSSQRSEGSSKGNRRS